MVKAEIFKTFYKKLNNSLCYYIKKIDVIFKGGIVLK